MDGSETFAYVQNALAKGQGKPSRLEFCYDSPTRQWSAPLISLPCANCGRYATRTLPYCKDCLITETGCSLRRTMLRDPIGRRYPFLGLFAEQDFEPGDVVLPYLGEVRSKSDWLYDRYGQQTVPYGFAHAGIDRYTDSALLRGAAANINTATTELENNLEFHNDLPLASLVAVLPISAGEELLVGYGDNYNVKEPNVNFETDSVRYKT